MDKLDNLLRYIFVRGKLPYFPFSNFSPTFLLCFHFLYLCLSLPFFSLSSSLSVLSNLHISFSFFLFSSLFSLHSFYLLDFSFSFPCPSLLSHLSSSSINSISSIFISLLTLSLLHSLFIYLPSLFFRSFIIIVVKFYCVT